MVDPALEVVTKHRVSRLPSVEVVNYLADDVLRQGGPV
jgi:hypothetical protein